MTRYPFSALEEAIGVSNVTHLAELLGVDRQTVYRGRRDGLTFEMAERLAEVAGFVPYELWPEWLGESAERVRPLEDAQRQQAERKRALYNARQRRYRSKPHVMARAREKRREYYAECGDYERARQRRYYEQNREREIERSRRNRNKAS